MPTSLRHHAFRIADLIGVNSLARAARTFLRLNLDAPITDLERHQNQRLQELLSHASRHVPFYRSAGQRLDEFPVINKGVIRERIGEFLAFGKSPESLKRVVTSGSTGTPFAVYHDRRKARRNLEDTYAFATLGGFSYGDELFYLKIWNTLNQAGFLKRIAQNLQPFDVTKLDPRGLDRIFKALTRNNAPKGILGYASSIDALVRFAKDHNLDARNANVTSIIAMSEGLDSETKQLAKAIFNVEAYSRYSNVENGIVAQQTDFSGDRFFVNHASYFLEILKTDGQEPATLGQIGRIVVTDLYNLAMPLIRYDTGDLGAFACHRHNDRLLLETVQGRMMDQVFDTSGNLISSFTVTNQMWKYPELLQYQFVQTGSASYKFILNGKLTLVREQQLINEFAGYFGSEASITVQYVDEIPLLASGKRKKVRNEWRDCPYLH
jgi:phenylacetate-CoA ligase